MKEETMSLVENVKLAKKGQYPMSQLTAEMQEAGKNTLQLWQLLAKKAFGENAATMPGLPFPKDPYGFWEAWSVANRSYKGSMLLDLHHALDSLLAGMHPYLDKRHPL